MKILKATVVSNSGHPDIVSLTTDLPSPYKCDEGTDVPLYLQFDCQRGEGLNYVKRHFPKLGPNDLNLVSVPSSTDKFSERR